MKTSAAFVAVVVAGASFAGLSGCEGTRGPASPGQDPAVIYPAITCDPGLAKFIKVDTNRIVFDARTTERPMAVSVPCRNGADNDIFIQYEFRWFDGGGRDAGTSGWKFETIPAGQERLLAANALDSRAEKWRLEIRSAR